ncbi:hypothetical protein C8R44DRAFT_723582 [Mycena epipterygia]|nr:hypothetical protein C8R44DRAFT_723582 [Mycena epipterygia]
MDLLRNRDVRTPLGPFDGQVAALANLGAEQYFITTNTEYVPTLPSLQLPHALFLRSDMRYGTDDPVIWPQQWTADYCHLPVIAKPGSRPEFAIMWWDPSPVDFIVGSAVTRGLGRLRNSKISEFLPPINELVARCKELGRKTAAPLSPLFGQLMNNILLWTEQLQTLPTTYTKMVFAVTSLQRAFLELDALYNYMTIYKPRIDNYMRAPPAATPVTQCVGAFTSVPSVAQQLWVARLPFWFLRPTYVFDAENILAVVSLEKPAFSVPDKPAVEAPPIVYSGNSTVAKIAAITRAAVQTPWYRDPFDIPDSRPRSLSPPPAAQPSAAIASSSRPVASSSHPAKHSNNQRERSSNQQPPSKDTRFRPYPSKSKAPAKAPTKTARDKFQALAVPEMPPSIPAWADALARVDQSVTPFTADPADRRYVLPEPALFLNTTADRRRLYLHHWNLLGDGFLYMLSQPEHVQLLSAQEWRDVLQGLMTKRGAPGSRSFRRSAALEDRIRPALRASDVPSIEGFPVPAQSVPDFSIEQAQEIVWQVAETSFRFEFCSLDRRASGKHRLAEVLECFAGHMLIGAPLEISKVGWAATAIEDRHRYAMRTARLMLDWTTKTPRPNIIRRVAERLSWSPLDMQALETAVCSYYTQAFWEYFGRAAVVPMRLIHVLETDDGQL